MIVRKHTDRRTAVESVLGCCATRRPICPLNVRCVGSEVTLPNLECGEMPTGDANFVVSVRCCNETVGTQFAKS